MRKTLALLILSLVFLALSGVAPFAEEEGWKTEKLRLVNFKSVKDLKAFYPASYKPERLFYEDGHWLDDEKEAAEYKNFYETAVGPATNSTKWRGIYIKREKMSLQVDTNGDDSTDTSVTKDGTIVTVNVRFINPDRTERLSYAFFMKQDEYSMKPHWSFARAYYWTGKIGSTPVYFFDDNNDAFLNVHASDGIVIGDEKFDGVQYGSWLSTIVYAGGKLYQIRVDEQGGSFDYQPYEGPQAKVDFASKFKGAVKPRFVVLRTPFDPGKPDPQSISLYLPKGVGAAPAGIYEFKWTMLTERCFGAPNPREGQGLDDQCMPYTYEKGEKKYFPVLRDDGWMKNSNNPVNKNWDTTNAIVIKENEKYVREWGEPFCIHPKCYHQTDDGGAKVDMLAFEAWSFIFYDSSGVCFWTPEELKTDGAALPEDTMYNILVYHEASKQPQTKNTRYVKGSGGGVGDASPNWVIFQVPLGNKRGTFRIEISTKFKVFGEIHNYADFKLE